MRYLGLFIVKSYMPIIRCSLDNANAKRSLHRVVNGIFDGEIGRTVSEKVVLELIKTNVSHNCMA